MAGARGIVRCVVLLAVGLLPASARAHLGHEIARAERYLKLDVAGHTARVVVSLTLGAAEGGRVLRAADADGDGRVSEAERDAYLADWGNGLREELPVEVDGVRQELVFAEPYLDPIGRVRAVPVTIEMVARFDLGGGRQSVRIRDAMVRREVYDRTDVAFRARDGARIAASGFGDEADPTPDLAYGPERARGQPVVLRAIVESPERPVELSWPWLVGAAVAVLALAGVLFVRRRAARA